MERKEGSPNTETGKPGLTNLELMQAAIATTESNRQIDSDIVTEITWRDLPLREIETDIRCGKTASQICEHLKIDPSLIPAEEKKE